MNGEGVVMTHDEVRSLEDSGEWWEHDFENTKDSVQYISLNFDIS